MPDRTPDRDLDHQSGRMARRQFLAATGGAALASSLVPVSDARVVPGDKTERVIENRRKSTALRTITYNILACRGYKQTDENKALLGKARKQIPARIAMELALYEPDIVTFQESPAERIVAEIAERLGMNHTYFKGGFPGAVLARFEIKDAVNKPLAPSTSAEDVKGLFTRHWGRAVLKTGEATDGGELVIYSAHLHPAQDGNVRAKEVPQIIAAMQADISSNRSMIFQGDLNHSPDGPEYQQWVDAGLRDALAEKGDRDSLSFPSTEPRVYIDYIWTHGPLADRLAECRVLFEGAFRTNPADPKSFATSDHLPVLAIFD